MNKQEKIKFDSKDEFKDWLNLGKNSNSRYHSFAEDEPWEYPCVMTVVEIINDIDSVNDIYYCFVYRKNLMDYEQKKAL